jgi:uncharacterized protein (DUF1501 family)
MLTLFSRAAGAMCDGVSRRDFLRVGSLGLAGLALPDLLRARAAAAEVGRTARNSSVVWLWLGGGATHIETFDPKMDAPAEFRSTVGAIDTALAGVQIGRLFPGVARGLDKMAIVRSFAHNDSGHGGGTHWVMTGYDNRAADNGGAPIRPSLGSITARVRGANHPATGIPTYVRMSGGIGADGAAWLGRAFEPFEPSGEGRKNMNLSLAPDRLADRRTLLAALDRVNRAADATGVMEGMDSFESQAFSLILGSAKDAFDISREQPETRARYGKGLGEQLLMARRLCQAGTGFVTVRTNGWDMHGNIVPGLNKLCPPLDQAVSAFVADVYELGLSEDILLVITGEFGRTPRVNKNAGRDHWSNLSTLALAGGGLRMGQVVGESNARAERPKSNPISPQDLMATVFHVLGIDPGLHYYNQAGRPTPMIETGKPIAELV